jgi:hypothetical protein
MVLVNHRVIIIIDPVVDFVRVDEVEINNMEYLK